MAAAHNNLELVKLILAKGVKIDARDSVKMTPLHWAAEAGHLDMVKFLVANGADPVARGNGSLPYDLAEKNKH
jgi:GA-binding protein transcription factor beta